MGDNESDGDAEGKVPTFCCAVDVTQLDRGESGTSPEPARGRQHLFTATSSIAPSYPELAVGSPVIKIHEINTTSSRFLCLGGVGGRTSKVVR